MPEIDPDVAVIVVEPAATPVTTPPGTMVATPVSEEDQLAEEVKT